MILTGRHQPAQDESRAEKPGWGRELDNKAVDDAKGCLRCPTSWQPFVWSQCSSWNWWWDDEMFIFAAKGGCRCDTLPLWSFSSAWFLQCAGHGEPHGWDCAMPSHYLSQLQHAGLLNAGLVWLVGKERCPSWRSPKWRTRLLQYHRRLTPSETPERANIRNTSTHSIYLPSWPLIIPADTCLCQASWRCCLLHLDNASIKSLQCDNHVISTYILYKI